MARHAPHRCRIARNPTPVHSALGERLTYRLLQVQRSLSKESQTSAVTWPLQPDNSASRDDQPRPRSLTTTSHPRVSGVLRYAGDLQHRSGQPAHQYRVHGAAAGSGRALFDGRSRSLSGQCVHQAVFIKRLWRSLKYEAVYLRQLADGFMAQRVIDEWSSSPTRCDRARHWMVGRRRPPTAGSRRPDRRWRNGHGAQVAIAGSDGRGPAGAQSGEGSYPQCPQDQAPVGFQSAGARTRVEGFQPRPFGTSWVHSHHRPRFQRPPEMPYDPTVRLKAQVPLTKFTPGYNAAYYR